MTKFSIKKVLACCIPVFYMTAVNAQSLESSFEFLKLPVSAHSASLGGHVVSVEDPDPTLFLSNPALLTNNTERTLGLNAMSWFSGTTVTGAQFCNRFDERSVWAAHARYVNYGRMDQTNGIGEKTGTFTAKDMALGLSWAYMLTNQLSGGVTANVISSRYASMTSVAIGVDLGLYYTDPDNNISAGLALTSMGGQIKAFENTLQKLPVDLCAGITWSPEHAPLRFTVSMDNLTHWNSEDFYFAQDQNATFSEILKRHISAGMDLNLTERFHISAGCNLKNRSELAGQGSRGFTGFTLGTGLRLGRVTFEVSYGKYQVSESSLICNFAFNI